MYTNFSEGPKWVFSDRNDQIIHGLVQKRCWKRCSADFVLYSGKVSNTVWLSQLLPWLLNPAWPFSPLGSAMENVLEWFICGVILQFWLIRVASYKLWADLFASFHVFNLCSKTKISIKSKATIDIRQCYLLTSCVCFPGRINPTFSILSSPSPPSLLSPVGVDKQKAAPKQRTISSTRDHECCFLPLHLLMDGINHQGPFGSLRDRTASYTSQMLRIKAEELLWDLFWAPFDLSLLLVNSVPTQVEQQY